ncbi:MAG TPA: DUF4262 domain-containing protein [Kofleriaceae bacterium]|nr:DUF4262 domain-containing protein [Kofleriaceae bacterium]
MGIANGDERQIIRRTIVRHGHQTYMIMAGSCPRFAYTVGVSESVGAELVLAGAAIFTRDEVHVIINTVATELRAGTPAHTVVVVEGLGSFTLRRADPTWVRWLLCCANAYYRHDVAAYQIVPDRDHWTVDVPDMTTPWSVESAPAWRFLRDLPPATFPASAHVATGLDVLRGTLVTRATRREPSYWEAFSNAPLTMQQIRIVPLSTLLATDESLVDLFDLPIGQRRWRPASGHPWRRYM